MAIAPASSRATIFESLKGKIEVRHNICPNLSISVSGKVSPPGRGQGRLKSCRQNQPENIPELQQTRPVFILFHETVSGSLAIFPIDKTVTGRI